MSDPRRGEIYWVSLDPAIGSESAKTRPGLIISNDIGNQYADRAIVAPITSSIGSKVYPFEVRIEVGEGGVDKPSKVLLDQIRTLDKTRLGRKLGALSRERMEQVNAAIRLSLAV